MAWLGFWLEVSRLAIRLPNRALKWVTPPGQAVWRTAVTLTMQFAAAKRWGTLPSRPEKGRPNNGAVRFSGTLSTTNSDGPGVSFGASVVVFTPLDA